MNGDAGPPALAEMSADDPLPRGNAVTSKTDRPTFADWQARAPELSLRVKGRDLVGTCPGCGYGTDDGFKVKPNGLIVCNGCKPDNTESGRQAYRKIMEAAGFVREPDPEATPARRPKSKQKIAEDGLKALDSALSETTFALQFQTGYGREMLHVRFGDSRPQSAYWWIEDRGWLTGDLAYSEAYTAMRFMIESAVISADGGNNPPPAKLIEKWGTHSHITGALKIAAADPVLRKEARDWDPNPDILGLPHGFKIDLPSGTESRQTPRDWISTNAAVTPDNNCPTPNLDMVVDHLSGGDKELAGYYWRVLGYSLFGHVREDKAFIWCGEGGSGKTTLILAVQRCLGDLATTMSPKTLSGDPREHGTFLMDLKGKRMAVISEWRGQVLSDRFKSLTGGETQKANRMRTDPSEFDNNAVLHMVANPEDMPTMRNPDEAMKRRIRVIPAGKKVEEADAKIRADILEHELPGVMARLLEGAAEYASEGLRQPESVTQATEEYFAAASPFGRFIEEQCETGDMEEDASALYTDFCLWWREKRFRRVTPTNTAFGLALTAMGYPSRKTGGRKVRSGLRLRTAGHNTA